jgi:hypothetical protein
MGRKVDRITFNASNRVEVSISDSRLINVCVDWMAMCFKTSCSAVRIEKNCFLIIIPLEKLGKGNRKG